MAYDPIERRRSACVNACKGIPTEALEAGVVKDLLKACNALLSWDAVRWARMEDTRTGPQKAIHLAQAAIAKAEGKA